ncbi:MAG: hypothetical protein IPO67_01445 [Deltaproteobacteria bacterium]|nr:hypothetical protein [Deltaproteobacteria bacterium]
MIRGLPLAALALLALVPAKAEEPRPAWESPRVPAGAAPPAGLSSMTAESCGACHVEIAAEWRASVHAHAWTDAQFQGEIKKDPAVTWLCLNCHTPAGDQQAELAVSTGDPKNPKRAANPSFNAAWREEGVSCASCHVQDGKILGVYGDGRAPHPVEVSDRLRSADVCLGCHQAVAMVSPTLACAFNTGEEWREWGGEATCQSCHMPEVTRPVAVGGPVREGRRHLFLGSLIPKDALSAEEEAYYALFAAGLDAELVLPQDAPAGTIVEGQLILHNARAGHYLPSGDPERHLLATVTIVDGAGQVVYVARYRVGQRWRWWPEAERLDDNRLVANERRVVPFSFPMPAGGATAKLVVEHRRISEEAAAYHALEGYPTGRVVTEAQRTLTETGQSPTNPPTGAQDG